MSAPLLDSGDLEHYRPLGDGGTPLYRKAGPMRLLLRQRLGEADAAMLAIPKPNQAGDRLDWYAPVAGPTRRWSGLDAAARAAVETRLEALARRVSALAEQLQQEPSPDARSTARLIRKALRIPSNDQVFVVAGRPVLTFWGFDPIDDAPAPGVLRPWRAAPDADTRAGPDTHAWDGDDQGVRRSHWGSDPVGIPHARGPAGPTPAARGDPDADHVDQPVPEPPIPDGTPAQRATTAYRVPNAGAGPHWWHWLLLVPLVLLLAVLLAYILPRGCTQMAPVVVTDPAEVPRLADGPEPTHGPPAAEAVAEGAPGPASQPLPDRASEPLPDHDGPLVIPDTAARTGSVGFIDGLWRAVTTLLDSETGLPVELEYRIGGGAGEVRVFKQGGIRCRAPVSARMEQGTLVIEGPEPIRCEDGDRFGPPVLRCRSGARGVAECVGRNDDGTSFRVQMHRAGTDPGPPGAAPRPGAAEQET